jgi:hypothetical protein
MKRNSRHQDGARIETVNDVDLGLRAPQLHGDGDTQFYAVPERHANAVEKLRTLHEKRVDAKAKINMEPRK